jgi:hypothetical protein
MAFLPNDLNDATKRGDEDMPVLELIPKAVTIEFESDPQ